MPRSSVNGFDGLAPDQRAALELVLRQGRSYAQLAALLGLPEETIRARARAGVAALAPDLPAPERVAEITDWLLGQQSEQHAAHTRELLLTDRAAHAWAMQVAAPLRAAPGGEKVPPLPTKSNGRPQRVNGSRAPAPKGGSSRLGGALIIGAALAVVLGVLVFVFTRGDDEQDPVTQVPTATPTPDQATRNGILLRGPAGSKAVGMLELVPTDDGNLRFALAAVNVPPNKPGETYSVWFRNEDGKAQLIGDVANPVGKDGELTTAGPSDKDLEQFPQWFATYENVIVTRDEKGAREPGVVLLSGDLPSAANGG
jgi:hypothetical protein